MAVAYSANKVGSAGGAVTVRDPVVTMVSLPRFLAPGDTARIGVVINNVEGAAGDYQLKLVGERRRPASPRRSSAAIPLAQARAFTDGFPLAAKTLGNVALRPRTDRAR